MISVTSSVIPLMVANSWSTPSILTPTIAKPSKELNKTLLKALPNVKPNPGSNGRNSNCPSKSFAFCKTILSGF
jgi:hypothetical protein